MEDNNFNKTELFENYDCQKVLPLTYDNSLSYYEVLCKLVGKTNELIDIINESGDTISEETAQRIEADTQLQNNINTEANTREQADTQLQANINTEKTARENADTQLQNNINTEANTREQDNATLQQNIDNISNDVFHKNQIVPIANGGTGASDVINAKKELMLSSYHSKALTPINENFIVEDNVKFFNGGIYFWGVFSVISNIETKETEFATFDLNTIGWKCKDFNDVPLNQFMDGEYLTIRCKNNILHFSKSNGFKKQKYILGDKYPIIFLN